MTSMALNNLWRYLQGLALTEKDRKWLAGKLQEPSLSPYTQEELDSMIKQSESKEYSINMPHGKNVWTRSFSSVQDVRRKQLIQAIMI